MTIGHNTDLKECQYTQPGTVFCDPTKHNCAKCGWNPDVAKARHKTMGIYPSVAELPTFGSYYGQILYVSEDKKIYPYVWEGNRWKLKKE